MTELFHGTWWEQHRGKSFEELAPGRFTQLFPGLDTAHADGRDLQLLAEAMTSHQDRTPTPEDKPDPEEDSEITAAYTYLGQFVDHDLTFDPTSSLREFLDAKQIEGLKDYRTPRFDLDNLYGRGPADQPYLYESDGIHMQLGECMSGNPFDPDARQVPRGPNGRALIGDPRNDENRIVAQLHAIFLRFHNRVADYLADTGQLGTQADFDEVRHQVRWHYQWLLVNDFLPTVVNHETYTSVFPDPYTPARPRLPGLQNGGLQLMPVEFSVAAFRFGHSMIRPEYRLNTTVERRPIFTKDSDDGAYVDDAADLGGFRPIPSDWAIDWQFFIDLEHGAQPHAIGPLYDPIKRRPQRAYKIDTSLVSPLRYLPHRIAEKPSILALRNLERGRTFGLASGQAVATALGEEPIPDKDLVIGKAAADDPKKPLVKIAKGFAGKAPLWAYILSEAQVVSWERAGSRVPRDDIPVKLGPVGGRIVAEVFAALLRGDRTSYLRKKTAFSPIPEFTHDGKFGLAELINVALGRAP
jgi:Animal haem peroxidase